MSNLIRIYEGDRINGDISFFLHVEGDIVGYTAGDTVLEGDAPCWSRDTLDGNCGLWRTHAVAGTALRDCGLWVTYTRAEENNLELKSSEGKRSKEWQKATIMH